MKPQAQRVLAILREAGDEGVTNGQARRWPDEDGRPTVVADRLAPSILELRRAGYEIETLNEPHEGGMHARYVLHGSANLAAQPVATLARGEHDGGLSVPSAAPTAGEPDQLDWIEYLSSGASGYPPGPSAAAQVAERPPAQAHA